MTTAHTNIAITPEKCKASHIKYGIYPNRNIVVTSIIGFSCKNLQNFVIKAEIIPNFINFIQFKFEYLEIYQILNLLLSMKI